jgi:hypothetical protein
MPRKKIIETTGKIEDLPDKPYISTLEQAWGTFNEKARYGTVDRQEYERKLADMNRPDLESHARTLGVVIIESTSRLRDRLLYEFDSYMASIRGPTRLVTGASKNGKISPTISEEVRKILAEGR